MPVYEEFTDKNLHRSYPLLDSSSGNDTSGSFTLPTSLITDMYLCVPNIPEVDVNKFYVSYVIARRATIEIGISYDDAATPDILGSFKSVLVEAPLQQTYLFTPAGNEVVGPLTALSIMTGQITIGNPRETSTLLGNWRFDPLETYISPTRVSQGLINVQYFSVGDNLFTGVINLSGGPGVDLDVVTAGDTTTITVNVDTDSSTAILTDDDVITALTNDVGPPIRSVNGILADANRDFSVQGGDCTEVTGLSAGISIGNPCATPCCPEDENIASLKGSVESLNLKYADLIRFYELNRDLVNEIQNKLFSLGNTL
jgi:hypothetical protein